MSTWTLRVTTLAPAHFCATFGVFSPPNPAFSDLIPLYLPFFCSFSPLTSIDFRNSNDGPIAFSSASNSASPFLSVRPCQIIPSFYKLLISFGLSFRQCRHLVYKCSTDSSAWPHHQLWGVSITPILAK